MPWKHKTYIATNSIITQSFAISSQILFPEDTMWLSFPFMNFSSSQEKKINCVNRICVISYFCYQDENPEARAVFVWKATFLLQLESFHLFMFFLFPLLYKVRLDRLNYWCLAQWTFPGTLDQFLGTFWTGAYVSTPVWETDVIFNTVIAKNELATFHKALV